MSLGIEVAKWSSYDNDVGVLKCLQSQLAQGALLLCWQDFAASTAPGAMPLAEESGAGVDERAVDALWRVMRAECLSAHLCAACLLYTSPSPRD